jgi:para-aminobenzoate synthetase component I
MHDWEIKMNDFGKKRCPFFFLISFDKKTSIVQALNEIDSKIHFKINNIRNEKLHIPVQNKLPLLNSIPVALSIYHKAFQKVMHHLHLGDSYLINLTIKTPVETNLNLFDIYQMAHAKYKLLIEDEFVVFSPECFIKINDTYIYTYPMKGTIDAAIENASDILLNDQKEIAEHYTIVDLLRNDLSKVASHVEVKKFRYVESIFARDKELLQTSSEIQGLLAENYNENLGSIFDLLLPAGSISGAPKNKTLDIIHEAESDSRGYYTGVFGVYDGANIDSAVAIRFIEKNKEDLYYRSGGGITAMSTMEEEYKELLDKIYVPTGRKHTNKK